MVMKVCYWGTYDQNYPRNQILISGLRKNGVEVIECHTQIWRDTAEKMAAASSSWVNVKVLWRWFGAYVTLLRRFSAVTDVDALIIGYSGHFDVFVAKILSKWRSVPLVFDAFLSLYDSLVFDRKVVRKGSFKARLIYAVDKYSCWLADIVLLDTEQHIDYFVHEFGLAREKFRRIFIGANDSIFFPLERERQDHPWTVIHYGKYIPLHGMTYIIRAARELEDRKIQFQLIGSGEEYETTVKLAAELKVQNIEFLEFVEQPELPSFIHQADICLGIFGDTDKARRVVPNKVYEAMAMKKPVITGNSPAAQEILSHGENCFLCEMSNHLALAQAIKTLINDVEQQQKIASGGYDTYQKYCSPAALGKEMKAIVDHLKPAAVRPGK
ncbi:glycosyltransferase [candidate division CSSED10-310 bacterium]|uniref:Glycosyltransferase n=1 Tax=candidate division CSSED10-310 bacterium TaxID=2855610 RepID=A0ABV6Z138_UNCC1